MLALTPVSTCADLVRACCRMFVLLQGHWCAPAMLLPGPRLGCISAHGADDPAEACSAGCIFPSDCDSSRSLWRRGAGPPAPRSALRADVSDNRSAGVGCAAAGVPCMGQPRPARPHAAALAGADRLQEQ